MGLTDLIIRLIILALSAIPLNIAIKLLGGRSTLMKVVLVNVLVGVIGAYLEQSFGFFAGILSFIAMLFIYKVMFEIGWLKAFAAWILQLIIIAVFVFVLFLFGISVFIF